VQVTYRRSTENIDRMADATCQTPALMETRSYKIIYSGFSQLRRMSVSA
jgi:hypothetical protein